MQLLSKVLLLTLFVSTGLLAESFDKNTAVSEAKTITKVFAGALQKELQAAMKNGGPANALNVCNAEAMPITADISSQHNAHVSRVSLKNRNPENTPDDWQKSVLEEFNSRAANGESIETMASTRVIENNGMKQFQFMKAMPTGGVCLACHGQHIDATVQKKLDEFYPEDKATGYSVGDVRGAIVVVKDYKP